MLSVVTRSRRSTGVLKMEVSTVPPSHPTSRGPPTLKDALS
jgi:hypothetical protein